MAAIAREAIPTPLRGMGQVKQQINNNNFDLRASFNGT